MENRSANGTRTSISGWSLDTGKQIPSYQNEGSQRLSPTLAERKTRFYIAVKILDRSADSMVKVMSEVLSGLPDAAVKTVICDRGSEFVNW